jgi:hypothetical protein
VVLVVVTLGALLAGCVSAPEQEVEQESSAPAPQPEDGPPERFTIVPDDYHVPYAGTAEDGRRFFLSEELGIPSESGATYVGLFLWTSDGTFDEVRADEVVDGAEELLDARLAELGDYTLEAIEVEPFTTKVEGVTFGWVATEYDGRYALHIEPGDFIAYYAPWDGLEYDT